VFDGNALSDADTVIIKAGLIAAVGRGLTVPAGAAVYAGNGATLLPGLIDAHVHTFPASLGDALRFGVTTMVDMFCDKHLLPVFKSARAGLTNVAEADVWSAGTLATVAGGHGTEYGLNIPTIGPETDLAAFVSDRIAEGSDFLKIIIEEGWPGFSFPTLSPTQVNSLVAAAHRAGVKAAVHVHSINAAATAVAAGADVLAHVPRDLPIPDTLMAAMRKTGTAVISTLSVFDAYDCGGTESAAIRQDPHITSWLSASQVRQLDTAQTGCLPRSLPTGQANLGALHRAGVTVMAGTDAGNPRTTAGVSLHEELQLLTKSGLTPTQALTAATSTPADMFGLTARGRIRVGHRADLVLVHGDPLTDITATRDIVAIWKNGQQVNRKQP
jgi:imidazolonepropionase-like amidohydrolase